MTLLEDMPETSPAEPEALIEEAREAQRRRYRRRGGASLSLLVLIGIGLGFLLVGGGDGRRSASGHGGAVAANVTGRGDGILYVETTGSTVSNGHRLGGRSGKLAWWTEERPPYSYWIRSRMLQETSVRNTITVYLPDRNQISVEIPLGSSAHGPVTEQEMPPPLNRAVEFLSGAAGRHRVPGTSMYSPSLFSRRLPELINNPSVTVDRNSTFRGSPAISFTAAHKSANLAATLYVTRRAARPLAYIETATFFGSRNRLVQRTTIVFVAYKTLAPAATHMPNLVAEYPHAKVPPWDRAYWRRYWSGKSSGTAAQRRQALQELRN